MLPGIQSKDSSDSALEHSGSLHIPPSPSPAYEHRDGGQGIWLGLWKVGFGVFPELKSLRQEQDGLVHSFFTIKLILPQSRCPTGTSCFLFSASVYSWKKKPQKTGKRAFYPSYSHSAYGIVSLAKGSRGGGLVRVRPANTGEHKQKAFLHYPQSNPDREQPNNLWLHTRNTTSAKPELFQGSRGLVQQKRGTSSISPCAHHPATAGRQEHKGSPCSYSDIFHISHVPFNAHHHAGAMGKYPPSLLTRARLPR